MKFDTGKTKNTKILPKHQQVVIVLETQREIDQLYSMINFVPIIEAVDLRDSDWISLRESLSETPIYRTWHNKLNKMLK